MNEFLSGNRPDLLKLRLRFVRHFVTVAFETFPHTLFVRNLSHSTENKTETEAVATGRALKILAEILHRN